jgi:hypothetical protein
MSSPETSHTGEGLPVGARSELDVVAPSTGVLNEQPDPDSTVMRILLPGRPEWVYVRPAPLS